MKKAASLFASGAPIATLKATDASGSQELQIRKAADGYYAKTTAMDGVYKVPNELGDAVNKDAEDFREKRVFDFAEEDPDKVELHDGSKGYFLTRSGEDWWSDGKKMDPLSVQEFLALDSHADGYEICDDRIFQPGAVPDGDLQGRQARRKSGYFKERKRLPCEESGWTGAV